MPNSPTIERLLKKREFLNVATADKNSRPNAVPKFLLKFEHPFVYMIDYSYGRTIANLRANPQASVCFMDLDNLESYCLNGRAELIEEGDEFREITREVEKKIIRLSADRVIEGTRTGKRHEHFELEMPDRFVVVKFKVEETVKIGARGDFYREGNSATN